MIESVNGVILFGVGTADVTVHIGPDQGDTAVDFALYGASNDSNPSSDPGNRIAESATRPPDSTLSGEPAYVDDETYTVQVTFYEDGPQLFQADIPASIAVHGGKWRGALTRASVTSPAT